MWNLELARKLIEAKGFRKDFVAANIGISYETLKKYLQGYSKPSRAVLLNMARLLGTTVEELETQKTQAS